jgi:hypothetical protein
MIDDVCSLIQQKPCSICLSLQAFINWQNVHKTVISLERLRKSSEDLEEASFIIKLALTGLHKDLS